MPQFPSITSASGIWTLKKQKRAQQGSNWPPLVLPDFQFNYVTMLLHGNGTNGAQNNTFLDSSTNAFSMTRNGTITQGTFSPFGSSWSNYFDGGGDWLQTASNSVFTLATGNFTVEAWVFLPQNNSSTYQGIVSSAGVSPNTGFTLSTDLGRAAISVGNASTSDLVASSSVLPINTWIHIAGVRVGNTLTLYVNGVSQGSVTTTRSITTSEVAVGAYYLGNSPTYPFTGYVSNVRVINSAIYTSNFTPSSTPLTAVAGTILLTCQSNQFRDASTNNFAITRNGDVSVEKFSPFLSSTEYSAATVGGSAYAAGTGYLTTTGQCLPQGTSDCCVEFWWYPMNFSNTIGFCKANVGQGISFEYQGSGSFATVSFEIYTQGAGGVSSLFGGNAYASTGRFQVKQWNHVAYVRTGDTHSIYCNGIRLYTRTDVIGLDWAATTNNLILTSFTHQRYLNGYVSSFRSVVGSSPYDANNTTITVPTSQLTAITNTRLLLNFANGGIIDNAMMNDLETVGTAQISTAQSKFGGSSMYFSGGGTGWLYSSQIASINGQLGATYTIEMFLRISNVTSFNTFFRTNVSSTGNNLILWRVGSGDLFFDSLNADNATITRISGGGLSVDTWYHIAVSVSQNSGKMFVNGVQVGSTMTFNPSSLIADGLYVGELSSATGYIDELRITKGVARYTANFTPPAAPFPDKGAV